MKVCSCCGRIYVSEKDFLRGTSRWRVCSHGHLYFNCSCESTIVIIKGKHDWYSPDKVMSERAATVFNSLPKGMELPLIPEVAMRIQQLLQTETASLDDLLSATRADPILALKIIKVANAGRPASTAQIETIREAIQFLGRKRLAEVTNPAAMVSFEFKTKKYTKDEFWSEAFTAGIVAEKLAQIYLKKEDLDTAYFSGIFANIGKVVGAILLPEEIDKVYESTMLLSNPMNWRQAEQHNRAIDHHVLGEIAATLWGLPPKLLNTIYHHHDPIQEKKSSAEKQQLSITEVAALANQLTHIIQFNSHRIDQEVLESCMKAFGIDDKTLETYIKRFSELTKNSNEVFAA